MCSGRCPICGGIVRSESVGPAGHKGHFCTACRANFSLGTPVTVGARLSDLLGRMLGRPHAYFGVAQTEVGTESLEQDGQRWTREAGGEWIHEATWNGQRWVKPTDKLPFPLDAG